MNRFPRMFSSLPIHSASMRLFSMRPLTLLLAAALTVFTLTSCDSLLDTEPAGSVSTEAVLQDRSSFEALLNSAYDRMQNFNWYSQDYMLVPEAQADNIEVTNENSNRYLDIVATADQSYLTMWGIGYNAINDVNNIIAKIDSVELEGDAEAFRNRIKGQAHFIRALSYFDLMRSYSYEPGMKPAGKEDVQGVIIRTEPTETIEGAAEQKSRAPISEVYDLIISDLNQAVSLLEPGGGAPFRANQTAAQTLLSRVHLYARNYAEAEAAATAALEDAPPLAENYAAAFRDETNPEAIFAIDMTVGQDGDATFSNEAIASLTIQGSFAFEVIPSQDPNVVTADGVSFEQDNPATGDLIGAFNPQADERFDLFVTGSKGQQHFFYSEKWLDTEAAYVTNVTVLRTAELYLNRAEARYRQGNEEDARNDVNRIRTRAGLSEISTGGSDLLNEILHQRRLEFNMEGHRFFDFKRRGQDIPKPQGASPRSVIPYNARVLLAPIPQQEVRANPNLEQNPGY